MMKNKLLDKSIVSKTFLITFISLMSIVSLIFFFQSIYLEKFYTENKIKKLAHNMDLLAEEYQKNKWDYETLTRESIKFSYANNATMNIDYYGGDSGVVIYPNIVEGAEKMFLITISMSGSYYDMYIDDVSLMKGFNGKMAKKYEEFYIKAYKKDDEILVPYEINSYVLDNFEQEGIDTVMGKAKIVEIVVVSEYYGAENSVIGNTGFTNIGTNITDNSYILNSDYDLMYDEFNNYIGSVAYNIAPVPFVNNKEVTLVKKVPGQKGQSYNFIVYASLQPVNEVIEVFNKYYFIFFIVAIVIALIIARFYSKFISKPVLSLISSANDIANMNFDVRVDETRADELGDLGKSLNTLSKNLNTALQDLKDANEQLTFDIEKEKKQENIRREFVANISHELKTPLSIIKGYAEGIYDGVKKEKKDYYIKVILEEIDRMNKLIFDMLELSKHEHSKLEKIENFEIRSLIDKAVASMEVKLDEGNVDIRLEGDFCTVRGSRFNISGVIINLLSNAIKHCAPNSTIRVRGEVKGKRNYIYIHNIGKPISEDDIDHIWLRFYKSDKSHNRDDGGTGLGLAIVKAILDKHKSDYGIRNIDNGVEVYFSMNISEPI